MSYPATIRLVDEISKQHKVPIQNWVKNSIAFEFIGDNVNKKKRVRDECSDNQSEMVNMYSILASKSRVPSHLPETGVIADLKSIPWDSFLPCQDDISIVKGHLNVLICRLLTKFFHDLAPYAKFVPDHIIHKYSQQMATKSEVSVIDVLLKDETRHADMIEIMHFMQESLGNEFPNDKQVLSMGDLVTCERQIGSQRHVMDGNTCKERLQHLQPQASDWHFQLCVLEVLAQ